MPAQVAPSGWQALTAHPRTPCEALQGAWGSLRRVGAGHCLARYRFAGRIDALRVPAPAAARRVDGLWHHLCGELFLMSPDGRYTEFNIAPSGCWAAYDFDAYRSGMRPAELPADPVVSWQREEGVLQLDAELALPAAIAAAASWRIALCAMVEEQDNTLSCWALRHAGDRPDFHHADGFMPLAD